MPAAFDRCVEHVKGKVSNPFAVCRASMGTDAQILSREQKKKKKKNPLSIHPKDR
jgi:hypothetical protein